MFLQVKCSHLETLILWSEYGKVGTAETSVKDEVFGTEEDFVHIINEDSVQMSNGDFFDVETQRQVCCIKYCAKQTWGPKCFE